MPKVPISRLTEDMVMLRINHVLNLLKYLVLILFVSQSAIQSVTFNVGIDDACKRSPYYL